MKKANKNHLATSPLAWLFLGLVRLYQLFLSPLIGANCRFQPTCSRYAVEAIQRYGALKGGWLTVKRLSKCHPWGGFGYDPVPQSDGTKNDSCGHDICAGSEKTKT